MEVDIQCPIEDWVPRSRVQHTYNDEIGKIWRLMSEVSDVREDDLADMALEFKNRVLEFI